MDNEIVWIVSGFGRMSLGMWLVSMLNKTKNGRMTLCVRNELEGDV